MGHGQRRTKAPPTSAQRKLLAKRLAVAKVRQWPLNPAGGQKPRQRFWLPQRNFTSGRTCERFRAGRRPWDTDNGDRVARGDTETAEPAPDLGVGYILLIIAFALA